MSDLSNLVDPNEHQSAQQYHRLIQQQFQQEHFKRNLNPVEYETLKRTAKEYLNKQIPKEKYDSLIRDILTRFPFPDNYAQIVSERLIQQDLIPMGGRSGQLNIQQSQTQQPVALAQLKSLKELFVIYRTLPKEKKTAFLKQHPEMIDYLKSLEKIQTSTQSQQQLPPSSSTAPSYGQTVKAAQASSLQIVEKSKVVNKNEMAGASKQDEIDKNNQVDEQNPDLVSVGVDSNEEEQNTTKSKYEQEQHPQGESQSPVSQAALKRQTAKQHAAGVESVGDKRQREVEIEESMVAKRPRVVGFKEGEVVTISHKGLTLGRARVIKVGKDTRWLRNVIPNDYVLLYIEEVVSNNSIPLPLDEPGGEKRDNWEHYLSSDIIALPSTWLF